MPVYLEVRELLATQFVEVYQGDTEQDCKLWLDQAKILGQFLKDEILSQDAEDDPIFYSKGILPALVKDSSPIAWDDGLNIRYVFLIEFRIVSYKFLGPSTIHGKTSVFKLDR